MADVRAERPPNYDEIVAVLPAVKGRANAVFTYAPYIYWMGDGVLTPDLMKHEEKHLEQQKKNGPAAWWKEYLADPEFRLIQEVEAYQAQYKAARRLNRAQRRILLNKISSDLASPMYGRILSKSDAKRLISNG